jgi:hypothetical protein
METFYQGFPLLTFQRNVFGIPLLVTLQRTGQPLPQCMLYAMRYLRKTAKDAVGHKNTLIVLKSLEIMDVHVSKFAFFVKLCHIILSDPIQQIICRLS